MDTMEEVFEKLEELSNCPEFDTQAAQDARGQEFIDCCYAVARKGMLDGNVEMANKCYEIIESVIDRMSKAGEENETD